MKGINPFGMCAILVTTVFLTFAFQSCGENKKEDSWVLKCQLYCKDRQGKMSMMATEQDCLCDGSPQE